MRDSIDRQERCRVGTQYRVGTLLGIRRIRPNFVSIESFTVHRQLRSLFSAVADSGCDHDEEYTNIQHFYGNKITDGTDEGVFQVRTLHE